MKVNKFMSDISILSNYKLINMFFILCFLFDFVITFSVVKYDYSYFMSNESNTQFIVFVNGDVMGIFLIALINLALFLPFVFVGKWYYRLKENDRTDKNSFYAYINCAILSLVISFSHIYGGVSWII